MSAYEGSGWVFLSTIRQVKRITGKVTSKVIIDEARSKLTEQNAANATGLELTLIAIDRSRAHFHFDIFYVYSPDFIDGLPQRFEHVESSMRIYMH